MWRAVVSVGSKSESRSSELLNKYQYCSIRYSKWEQSHNPLHCHYIKLLFIQLIGVLHLTSVTIHYHCSNQFKLFNLDQMDIKWS
jgi:hypothetical protein